MTVSSIIPVNNYTGNGSNKIFDFDFLIENPEELVVTYISKEGVMTDLTLGVDYSINEVGSQYGSYITFPLEQSSYDVLQEDETLSLALSLEIKQESEFANSANLNLKVLEWTFDYIVRIIQMLSRRTDRAVKVKEGSDATPDELIDSLNEAQKVALNSAQIATDKAQEAENFAQSAINATNYAQLNRSQITNCVLELPQTIKYEVNETGLIRLLAGSEVYMLEGGEYSAYTLSEDTEYGAGGFWGHEGYVVYDKENNGVIFLTNYENGVYSQEEAPSEYFSNSAIWEDTATNTMKYTTDAGATWRRCSLPILFGKPAYYSEGATGNGFAPSAIYNVFNGVGFIGQKLFVLPNVKYLIPDGLNEDGTLHNIEKVTSKVVMCNLAEQCALDSFLYSDESLQGFGSNDYYEQAIAPEIVGTAGRWYSSGTNEMYATTDGKTWTKNYCIRLCGVNKKEVNGNIGGIYITPLNINAPYQEKVIDYDCGESKLYNVIHTAEEDGYVTFNACVYANANYTSTTSTIDVKGFISEKECYCCKAQASWDGSNGTVNVANAVTQQVRIYKGQTYKLITTLQTGQAGIADGIASITFYPLKRK